MPRIKVVLEFIPVEEKLPPPSETGHIKFVLTDSGGISRAYLDRRGLWVGVFADPGTAFTNVTHWANEPPRSEYKVMGRKAA